MRSRWGSHLNRYNRLNGEADAYPSSYYRTGLQSAGKTSLVNLLAIGQFSDEMVPTVGFNMRKVKSGNVAIKVWDIG
jgi:hypothetical protein